MPEGHSITAAITKTKDYSELIGEVYLDAIRSAVIVDDDYITLDHLLKILPTVEDVTPFTGKYKKLIEVIEACKSEPYNWLVDVNDAKQLDEGQYGNLHQSDLMILDYHLEGREDGTKALKIIQSLAENDYFNLVIVYSKCKSSKELDDTVTEIARSLTFGNPPLIEYKDGMPPAPPELEAWEDEFGDAGEGDVGGDLMTTLFETIRPEPFLKFLGEKELSSWKKYPGFEGLLDIIEKRRKLLKDSGRQNRKTAINDESVKWILATMRNSLSGKLAQKNYGKVDFSVGDTNWIKTKNLFVTVISKDASATDLPKLLLKAIEASDPSPHQLIMSKIRNVMDQKGATAEKDVLLDGHLQAYWLNEMLLGGDEQTHKRSWKLKQTIRHHWDELASKIVHDVNEYGESLFQVVKSADKFDVPGYIQKYTLVNVEDTQQAKRIKAEWNSFVCRKPIDELHLMTGHIFRLSKIVNGVEQEPEKDCCWICLSPACDLVPGQKEVRWGGNKIKPKVLPFKAVKFFLQDDEDALDVATKSEHFFLKTEKGDIESYSHFRKGSPEANPVWDQFFAHNLGYIKSGKKIRLSALSFTESDEPVMEKIDYEATIVGQLRYEYALNMLQKLGGSLSRIGLDFVDHKKPEKPKK